MIYEIIKIIELSTDDAYHSYNEEIFVTTTTQLFSLSAQFLLKFKNKKNLKHEYTLI